MNVNLKPALAEFIGTFILIFIGAGSAALGSGGIVGVALAHGLAITVIVYALGAISGAHVNPAVTLGVALLGGIQWAKAVWYWAAQLIGGVAAAFVLYFVLGAQAGNLGATTLASGVSPVQGVVIEALLTAFLLLAVIASGVKGRNGNAVGLAIGLAIAMDILLAGSLTGASMNPARTLGPAIVSGNFADLWVYLVGPLAGAAAAVGLSRAIES